MTLLFLLYDKAGFNAFLLGIKIRELRYFLTDKKTGAITGLFQGLACV